MQGDRLMVSKLQEKKPFELSVHHLPLCLTFYFYDKSSLVLIDPNVTSAVLIPKAKEEKLAEGRLTIAINIFRDVCGIHTSGNLLLSPETIFKHLHIAENKVATLTEQLREAYEKRAALYIVDVLAKAQIAYARFAIEV